MKLELNTRSIRTLQVVTTRSASAARCSSDAGRVMALKMGVGSTLITRKLEQLESSGE